MGSLVNDILLGIPFISEDCRCTHLSFHFKDRDQLRNVSDSGTGRRTYVGVLFGSVLVSQFTEELKT